MLFLYQQKMYRENNTHTNRLTEKNNVHMNKLTNITLKYCRENEIIS